MEILCSRESSKWKSFRLQLQRRNLSNSRCPSYTNLFRRKLGEKPSQMKIKMSSARIFSFAGQQSSILCNFDVDRITICHLGSTAKWQVCTNTNVLTTAQFWAKNHYNRSSQKKRKYFSPKPALPPKTTVMGNISNHQRLADPKKCNWSAGNHFVACISSAIESTLMRRRLFSSSTSFCCMHFILH